MFGFGSGFGHNDLLDDLYGPGPADYPEFEDEFEEHLYVESLFEAAYDPDFNPDELYALTYNPVFDDEFPF